MVHLLERLSRRRDKKKPRTRGGVFSERAEARSLSRASIRSPRKGSFFRQRDRARNRDHGEMMIRDRPAVNGGSHIEPDAGGTKKSRARESPALSIGHVGP